MIEYIVKEIDHTTGYKSYMVYRSDVAQAMAHVHKKDDAEMILKALQLQESLLSLRDLEFKYRREE